jgi:hypothetical protein
VDGEAPGQSGRRLVEVDGLEETCAHVRVETARTQRRTRGPEGHGDGAEKNKAPSCRRSLSVACWYGVASETCARTHEETGDGGRAGRGRAPCCGGHGGKGDEREAAALGEGMVARVAGRRGPSLIELGSHPIGHPIDQVRYVAPWMRCRTMNKMTREVFS